MFSIFSSLKKIMGLKKARTTIRWEKTHEAAKGENNSMTIFDAEIFRFICS